MNSTVSKSVLYLLLILNGVVLMGQLWPEGAPPFARWVNVFFLAGNAGFILSLIAKSRQKQQQG